MSLGNSERRELGEGSSEQPTTPLVAGSLSGAQTTELGTVDYSEER